MTRMEQIELAASKARDALRGTYAPERSPEEAREIAATLVDVALALPADLVSVDERERALVEAGLEREHVNDCPSMYYDKPCSCGAADQCFAAVNATHPRAPSVEVAAYERDVLLSAIDALVAYNDGDATLKGVPGAGALARARDTVVTHRAISPEGQVIYRALAPVAQVAPSEAAFNTQPLNEATEKMLRVWAYAEDGFERAMVRGLLASLDAARAPSAPRDQGGGLSDDAMRWGLRVIDWLLDQDDIQPPRELCVRRLFDDVGPPPTDGVAAAYERAAKACDAVADKEGALANENQYERAEWKHAHASGVAEELAATIRALAAPVSEKERAK